MSCYFLASLGSTIGSVVDVGLDGGFIPPPGLVPLPIPLPILDPANVGFFASSSEDSCSSSAGFLTSSYSTYNFPSLFFESPG